jgi:hypothetical protein
MPLENRKKPALPEEGRFYAEVFYFMELFMGVLCASGDVGNSLHRRSAKGVGGSR